MSSSLIASNKSLQSTLIFQSLDIPLINYNANQANVGKEEFSTIRNLNELDLKRSLFHRQRLNRNKREPNKVYNDFMEISIKKKTPKTGCELVMGDPSIVLKPKYFSHLVKRDLQENKLSTNVPKLPARSFEYLANLDQAEEKVGSNQFLSPNIGKKISLSPKNLQKQNKYKSLSLSSNSALSFERNEDGSRLTSGPSSNALSTTSCDKSDILPINSKNSPKLRKNRSSDISVPVKETKDEKKDLDLIKPLVGGNIFQKLAQNGQDFLQQATSPTKILLAQKEPRNLGSIQVNY